MIRMRFVAAVCAIVITTLLAGCGDSLPQGNAVVPATAVTVVPATARSAALPGDNVSTPRYKIAIHYPSLTPADTPLMRALRANTVAAKRDFMPALPAPGQRPQFADRQLQLLIDYSVAARTPWFVSVREKGMADTGGAHPIPIDASFVYDTRARQVIGLDDLFTDAAQARQRFSDVARKALRSTLLARAPAADEASAEARKAWTANMQKMIDEGSAPSAANFSEFIIDAGDNGKATGITLLFPPYQVAPYVYGTQSVRLAPRDFADLLKPGYREAFVGG